VKLDLEEGVEPLEEWVLEQPSNNTVGQKNTSSGKIRA